jgi:AhpC/TSA family
MHLATICLTFGSAAARFSYVIPYSVGENSMRKLASRSALALLVIGQCFALQLQAQATKPEPAPALKVGDTAPDFKLQYFDGSGPKDVSLSQYRGKKNVALAFYVFAFTGG